MQVSLHALASIHINSTRPEGSTFHPFFPELLDGAASSCFFWVCPLLPLHPSEKTQEKLGDSQLVSHSQSTSHSG